MFTNLRQAMKGRNVTQSDLSILLNISRISVNRKLQGHQEFTLSEIHSIRDVYFDDMNLEYLFKRGD